MKISESMIVSSCLEFLQWKGIFSWRSNQAPIPTGDGRYRRFVGLRGAADIQGVVPGGKALHVEIKTETGKLSPFQEEFLDRVSSLGGIAIVARSVEELEKDLKEVGVLDSSGNLVTSVHSVSPESN